MKKFISAYFILCFFSLFTELFAQISVLSPVEGTWSNKQMLVIEASDNNEYLYSVNGSDPELFGFAYDGPVLIDMTGEIELRVKKLGSPDSILIRYFVEPDQASSESYESFISSFYDTGIISYVSGTQLQIPTELQYSMGLPPLSFMDGRTVSISEKSVLSRLIPCTIQDPNSQKRWRFIIRTLPQTAGLFSRRDVPFYITDWDTITFTDENLIYKIDSEFWELPKTERKLDRSIGHMISWQSLSYEQGNPVEFFVLPPKPKINENVDENGCILYTIEGDDSYTFSLLSESTGGYQELFTQVGADTFFGDSVSGKLKIGVFANAVYQGELEAKYNINKRPPSVPTIIASQDSFYSRDSVSLEIRTQSGAELYYSVSDPFFIQSLTDTYNPDSEIFKDVKADFFVKAKDNIAECILEPQAEGAVYYKVRCYAKNSLAVSEYSEYSVIIDQYNYYFSQNADAEIADGTALKPFAAFNQCLDAINNGRNACLYIKGVLQVPKGQNAILSNCTLKNAGDAVIEFTSDSSIVVKSASLEIENCLVRTDLPLASVYKKIIPLFKLEKSVLTMTEAQVSATDGKNITLIEAFSSNVNIFDSILSVNAQTYSSCISSVSSNLNLQTSSIYTSADTSVILSAKDGTMNVRSCTFKVTAKQGRIAEFFGTRGRFENNLLKSDLGKSTGISLIYQDEKSTVTEKNNDLYGF